MLHKDRRCPDKYSKLTNLKIICGDLQLTNKHESLYFYGTEQYALISAASIYLNTFASLPRQLLKVYIYFC